MVEQVREKTTNIQALVHSTVGQSWPVSVQQWGEDLGVVQPGLLEHTTRLSLPPQAPLKRLFPSIISITWPLLFFDYEGTYIQVGGDETAMPAGAGSRKPPRLDGKEAPYLFVFFPPQAGQILK